MAKARSVTVASGVRAARPEDRKTLKRFGSDVFLPSFRRSFACSSRPVGGAYGWIVGSPRRVNGPGSILKICTKWGSKEELKDIGYRHRFDNVPNGYFTMARQTLCDKGCMAGIIFNSYVGMPFMNQIDKCMQQGGLIIDRFCSI
ncbi:hypothetical protein RGR602_PC00632 (plasmid) [Rhizobium gallicum bv. gallicum R602sp]|uniref:Uncharacterized protein n=1 Tax=Rhizobium gallicum bv. gallicum R602sp TaxID=1041138 RepID=A0A0B4XD01_9HYPH|nr:hypothetical protein RGR602_PC00632 [Rhizobium gallicum bv. gallicum R602sp]